MGYNNHHAGMHIISYKEQFHTEKSSDIINMMEYAGWDTYMPVKNKSSQANGTKWINYYQVYSQTTGKRIRHKVCYGLN